MGVCLGDVGLWFYHLAEGCLPRCSVSNLITAVTLPTATSYSNDFAVLPSSLVLALVYFQLTLDGATFITAFVAMLFNAVASLYASINRDNSEIRSVPAFPLGTSIRFFSSLLLLHMPCPDALIESPCRYSPYKIGCSREVNCGKSPSPTNCS